MYFSDMFSHLRKSSWNTQMLSNFLSQWAAAKREVPEQDLPRRSSDDSGLRQSWRMTTTSNNNNNKKDPTKLQQDNNDKNEQQQKQWRSFMWITCFDMFWYVSMPYVAMLISERSRFHLAPLGLSWSLWRAAQRFESSQCEGGVEEQLWSATLWSFKFNSLLWLLWKMDENGSLR